MALIEVQIPEEGLNVLGLEYAGGRTVAVPAARARVLVEAGAEVVHDVLGELTGLRPDSVEAQEAATEEREHNAFTTADLSANAEVTPIKTSGESVIDEALVETADGDVETDAEAEVESEVEVEASSDEAPAETPAEGETSEGAAPEGETDAAE